MPAHRIGGKRRHIVLAPPQDARLEKLSNKTGLSECELIRRAIDVYFRAIDEQSRRASTTTRRP